MVQHQHEPGTGVFLKLPACGSGHVAVATRLAGAVAPCLVQQLLHIATAEQCPRPPHYHAVGMSGQCRASIAGQHRRRYRQAKDLPVRLACKMGLDNLCRSRPATINDKTATQRIAGIRVMPGHVFPWLTINNRQIDDFAVVRTQFNAHGRYQFVRVKHPAKTEDPAVADHHTINAVFKVFVHKS